MTNFILLHGGFHGAWCWEALIQELQKRGNQAFALDLPGHGSDPTPRDQVNRDSYISAARNFVSELSLDAFTLIGHSLAGIILPDVAAAFPSQVTETIYIAGLVLAPGERAIDLIPESRRPGYYALAEDSLDQTLWLSFEQARGLFLSDIDESAARNYYQQLTPQPFKAYLDPAASLDFSCPVRYIVCNQDQTLAPELCISWAEKLNIQPLHIDSGHDVMLSKPGDLAELLLG